MSRNRLQFLVSRATGESCRTIRQRGFNLLRLDVPIAPLPSRLCLSCPGCGREVSLQSTPLPEWAECDRCDIAYPYDESEVFLPDGEFAGA